METTTEPLERFAVLLDAEIEDEETPINHTNISEAQEVLVALFNAEHDEEVEQLLQASEAYPFGNRKLKRIHALLSAQRQASDDLVEAAKSFAKREQKHGTKDAPWFPQFDDELALDTAKLLTTIALEADSEDLISLVEKGLDPRQIEDFRFELGILRIKHLYTTSREAVDAAITDFVDTNNTGDGEGDLRALYHGAWSRQMPEDLHASFRVKIRAVYPDLED